MKTWHKWSLGVVLALVVVLAGALGVLYASVNPSAYRGRIEALASQALGRKVEIRGPITLSMFPWPTVKFDNVRVVDSTGVGHGALAHARAVRVTPRPLALLTGRLAVNTVTIDGLDLRLTRGESGRTNWQGVIDAIAAGPGEALGAAPVKTSRTPHRIAAGLPLTSMAVDAVHIRNARISYDNAQSGRHWKLYDASLETGRMTDGNPFRLQASGRLTCDHAAAVLRMHLVTRIEPHLADRFYRFSDLGLNVLATGASVPGGEQEANIGASGDIDFNSGRFGLDDVSFQSAGLTVDGNIDGEGLNNHLSYYGRLTVLPFSPRSVMQQLEIAPPHTQSSNALRQAGFDAQFVGGAHAVRFRQIAARLDDSHLTGTAKLEDFADPRVHFALALNALDIDNYLPPGSAEQASGNTAGHAGKGDTVNFALLRAIRFAGHLSIGKLTAANLTLRRAEIALAARNGRLKVDSLTAAAYGGRLDLAGHIDAAGGTPHYALRGRLRHIALGGVIADAVDRESVHGIADFDLDLTASGRRVVDLKRSLGGFLALHLTGGRIDGYDLAAAIARHNSGEATDDSPPVTPIESMTARFTLAHGLATSEDLSLSTPHLTAIGSGTYSVPNNRLAYRLLVGARAPDRAVTGREIALRVPVLLDGSLLSPSPAIGRPVAPASPQQRPRQASPQRQSRSGSKPAVPHGAPAGG